jgi:mono/diheme cytochrome c family protein
MALFFLKSTDAHKLKDAPGGAAQLSKDQGKLRHGKEVFAGRCARCHSSKLPPIPADFDPGGCSGPNYMNCWNSYWKWTKPPISKRR